MAYGRLDEAVAGAESEFIAQIAAVGLDGFDA
jgi:hypothetical protein